MNTKHTPGPWTVTTNGINTPDGHIVYFDVSGGLHKTDARLIAAAPDLLEALQMLSETAGRVAQGAPVVDERGFNTLSHSISAALAAIDKATK